MAYLYETHLHTYGVSACGISRGSDYIKAYKERGYTGIIVTDHFYNGNTALSRDLPWDEWVNRFCGGYEDAKEEGDRQGLDVFFGWEETFDKGDDYLVYGLDKGWMLEHPEIRYWSRLDQYRAVKKAGGCVVQAHPFRQRDYIKKIVLSTGCVDGVEAANGGNNNAWDALAYRYAKNIGKTIIAGSDIHDVSAVYADNIFGVYLDIKLDSIDDFVKVICNNDIAGIKTSGGRFNFYGNETVDTPVEVRGKNDKAAGRSWKEYV
ncbi:MAG: PHP domain-containing protein [Treponema sp.]|jgi:hypothetical protein|nr:PHP domain-containing protein [Treponema sp.]